MMAAVRVCGILVTCLFCLALTRSVDSDNRPRGVAISKASLYDPSRAFTCLDGSKTIDFLEVNDDYCDCPDGTDEPGTGACSNGLFHCTNAGHRPMYIHSSKVNDGICDCCDTTDEYDGIASCNNNCKELGAAAKEERKRDQEKQQQGYHMRSEYSLSGKDKRQDRENRKTELDSELKEIGEEMSRLEAIKKEAEEKAEAAKQEHISQWKAEREAKDREAANEAFLQLDIDRDGILSIAEMQAKLEFDKDNDGVVSPDEAQEYLNQTTDVNRDNFFVVCWSIIKDVFPRPPEAPTEEESTLVPPAQVPEVEVPETSEEPPTEQSEEKDEETDNTVDDYRNEDDTEEDDEEDDDDDNDDDDNYPDEPDDEKPAAEPELEGMPEFDDQTKSLIEAAEKAAAEFKTVSKSHSDKQDEMNNIEKDLQLDLGPDEEFYPLQGHCYDFTDREYTYSLCPFNKVTQKPKHGGRETLLGNWGEFSGEKDGKDKYSRMLYTGGERCWNGPDRQAKITLKCGVTNELMSASEPNRCEYAMDFVTPAVCKPVTDHLHEEL